MTKILKLIISGHLRNVAYLTLVMILCACGGASGNNSKQNDMRNDKTKIDTFSKEDYVYDKFTTPKGRVVNLIFIKHGSITIDIDGYLVYVDPVTIYGNDFAKLPKADLIMVTHEHHDHFDTKAIEELTSDSTRLIGSRRITELYGSGETMLPGQTIEIPGEDIVITATPAYNITPDHLAFHPKDRQDDGFIFDIDGMRIYVAGDTENIPEMQDLKDIDIAFLPVNQPYTMTPQQAIEAVEVIKPKTFYPYHYGDTNLAPLTEALKGSGIDLRIRQLQ